MGDWRILSPHIKLHGAQMVGQDKLLGNIYRAAMAAGPKESARTARVQKAKAKRTAATAAVVTAEPPLASWGAGLEEMDSEFADEFVQMLVDTGYWGRLTGGGPEKTAQLAEMCGRSSLPEPVASAVARRSGAS